MFCAKITILVIDYGIAFPRFWQKWKVSEERTKFEIDKTLDNFTKISGIIKEMGRGMKAEFLRKKIESIAKEKGRELPSEAKILLAQIAALVKE